MGTSKLEEREKESEQECICKEGYMLLSIPTFSFLCDVSISMPFPSDVIFCYALLSMHIHPSLVHLPVSISLFLHNIFLFF